MEIFTFTLTAAVVAMAGLILLIRRNLRQRPRSRQLRDHFIAIANDLVGKSELPDQHARQLVELSAMPGGWITRLMVMFLVKRLVFGGGIEGPEGSPKLEQVPPNLRARYVTAILTIVLSDSYRCALLGRVLRGANSWLVEAVHEVTPDVNAHATRIVVDQMSYAHAPKRFQEANDLVCVI